METEGSEVASQQRQRYLFGSQSSLCRRAEPVVHSASAPTRPLNQLVLRSLVKPQLLSLIQTSFHFTAQLRFTLLTPPSVKKLQSASPLVVLQPLQFLHLRRRHRCLNFSCWSSQGFILYFLMQLTLPEQLIRTRSFYYHL